MNFCRALSDFYLGTQFNQFIKDTIQECRLQQDVGWLKTCRSRKITKIASQIFVHLLTLSFALAVVPRRWLPLNMHTQKLLEKLDTSGFAGLFFLASFVFAAASICLDLIADRIYQDFIKLTIKQLRNVPEAWAVIRRYKKNITELDLDEILDLTDAQLEQVISHLPDLVNIQVCADQLSLRSFTQIQHACPKLERLYLQGTCFLHNPEYEIFEQFQTLRTLSIQKAEHLDNQGFKSICCLFHHNLDSLSLTSNLLNRDAIRMLCQIPNLSLDSLSLYSSALEPLNFLPLIQAAKSIKYSISFKCRIYQRGQIPMLLEALNHYHFGFNGKWTCSYSDLGATLYYQQNH